MKRIARWSTIFLLLCSIIWAGTASAAMIVENNMSALNTLNTINKNQTPHGKDSALERLAKEIGAAWQPIFPALERCIRRKTCAN